MNLHKDAESAINAASAATKNHVLRMASMLATGFRVTWFKEIEAGIWMALVKPSEKIAEDFGLRLECLLIGNSFEKDFYQRTLKLNPPQTLLDRYDESIRFVASNAPMAEAHCTAWAQRTRCRVVLLRDDTRNPEGVVTELYQLLGNSLWRRDFYSESEPVRQPQEFFGRESLVTELMTKILGGSPVAMFGLRKIGKSSILGRLDDLLREDNGLIAVIAFVAGNATVFTTGRWWHFAIEVLSQWIQSIERLADAAGIKVNPKAERLQALVSKNETSTHILAAAFTKDVISVLNTANYLQQKTHRDSVKLVLILDECDHLYPHLPNAGYWREDFFAFWNTVQAIKRGLDQPEDLVYILSGVNPSGVEMGRLRDQANPLYEMQKIYVSPMHKSDAYSLMTGIGDRMGLAYGDEALEKIYEIVGGHPLLLRKLGSAIHELKANRAAKASVSRRDVEKSFERKKSEFFNQVLWILEHLAQIAPDEGRLLRDIATGSVEQYVEIWEENEFRETFAHHLERYGLVRFTDTVPEVTLSLVTEALRRPAISEFIEQKNSLRAVVDDIEQAIRIRIRNDIERHRSSTESVEAVIQSIPSEAKNRPLSREDLRDLGEHGLEAVLQALNWGDYANIFNKFHDEIQWSGPSGTKESRLKLIHSAFDKAHVVRHNNDHKLKEMIRESGFSEIRSEFGRVRDMITR